MTDRELLEAAAKVAGIEYGDKRSSTGSPALYLGPDKGWWNPLDDEAFGDDATRRALVRAVAQTPAWHDAPTVPGDWAMSLAPSTFEVHEKITQKEIDGPMPWPGRWYGPIPEDKR